MVAWARYASNVLVLLALLGPRSGRRLWRTRAPALQWWRGVALGASTAFMIAGLARMPLAEASAIVFLTPVLVAAASGPLLGEPASRGTWLALVASFAGVLLIVRPGTAAFSWAALLPLGTAVCGAAYQLLTRRLSGVDAPTTTLFLASAIGALMMSFAAPFAWRWPLVEWWHLVPFVASGAVGAAGHFLMIRAFDHASPAVLAPFGYLQIVAVLLLGWTVFGEFPDAVALAGMGLIVATGMSMALRR